MESGESCAGVAPGQYKEHREEAELAFFNAKFRMEANEKKADEPGSPDFTPPTPACNMVYGYVTCVLYA
jgi:hypothetical protein